MATMTYLMYETDRDNDDCVNKRALKYLSGLGLPGRWCQWAPKHHVRDKMSASLNPASGSLFSPLWNSRHLRTKDGFFFLWSTYNIRDSLLSLTHYGFCHAYFGNILCLIVPIIIAIVIEHYKSYLLLFCASICLFLDKELNGPIELVYYL